MSTTILAPRASATRLVSFTGPDGVGKTTQIKLLLDEMRKSRQSVEYIHMFSKKGSFLNRFIYTFKVFSRERSNNRQYTTSARYGRVGMLLLKSLLTILDSWITYCYMMLKYNHKIIICDRYFYDNIVYLAASDEKLTRLVLHFSSLIPKPDVAILLRADPEVLYRRKSGQNLNSLQRTDGIFIKLAAKERLIILSTETDVGTLHKMLGKILDRGMPTA